MIYFLSSIKKYKIKLFSIILTVILLNLLFFPTKNFKENVAQNLRIYTCQPNFTNFSDTQQFKIVRLYYGFINFIKNGCKYEKIKIDINFKNIEKIKEDRKKAINNSILTNPQKVPASIVYKGKRYKAKVRLKGDLPGHWALNKQWSLRVELNDKKSINKMNEFSITKLIERRYPDNLLISNQFKRLGLITPNFKIYKVNVNGDDWGLMLAEEQFSNIFLENRKLKDGLIFKFTNEAYFFIKRYVLGNKAKPNEMLIKKQGNIEVDIFNKKKISKSEHFRNHETLIKSINVILTSDQEVKKKYDLIKKYFNVTKLARLMANALVFQTSHTLHMSSTRFYLNPYNLIIEPIPTDNRYESHQKLLDKNDYNRFLLNVISDVSLYNALLEDKVFINEYNKSLLMIISDLPNIKNDAHLLCQNFEEYCKKIIDFRELEERILKLIELGEKVFPNGNYPVYELLNVNKSIKAIDNKINLTSKEDYSALKILNTFIYARLFNDYLKVYNLTLDEIELKNIYLYYDDNNIDRCKKFIKKNCKLQKNNLDVNLNKSLNKTLSKKINLITDSNKKLVWGEIVGNIKNQNFTYKIRLENKKFDDYNLIKEINYKNKNLNNLNGNTYIINGKLTINEPIIVPKNYNLKIESGSELSFSENAYIYLNQGSLFLDGEKKLIKLLPKNKFWRGIYVNNSPKKSKINNAEIESTQNFKHESISLTGGINFYKSDVEISNTKILDNKCEDAVNIVNSNFILKNSLIKDSSSDGLDSDFSNGSIQETTFKNIGGDAIDTSGSEIFIKNTKIYKASDKGLSAGEKSTIKIENILVESSKFGIVSKDLSNITGNDIVISNSKEFDVMAFQKKMHYGPGFININKVKSNNKIIAQKNSIIKINNKKIVTKSFNPDKFY